MPIGYVLAHFQDKQDLWGIMEKKLQQLIGRQVVARFAEPTAGNQPGYLVIGELREVQLDTCQQERWMVIGGTLIDMRMRRLVSITDETELQDQPEHMSKFWAAGYYATIYQSSLDKFVKMTKASDYDEFLRGQAAGMDYLLLYNGGVEQDADAQSAKHEEREQEWVNVERYEDVQIGDRVWAYQGGNRIKGMGIVDCFGLDECISMFGPSQYRGLGSQYNVTWGATRQRDRVAEAIDQIRKDGVSSMVETFEQLAIGDRVTELGMGNRLVGIGDKIIELTTDHALVERKGKIITLPASTYKKHWHADRLHKPSHLQDSGIKWTATLGSAPTKGEIEQPAIDWKAAQREGAEQDTTTTTKGEDQYRITTEVVIIDRKNIANITDTEEDQAQ